MTAATYTLRLTDLEAAISALQDAVLILAADGHVLLANPAALRLYGVASLEDCRSTLRVHSNGLELRRPGGDLVPFEEQPLSRALHGEFVRDQELQVRTDTGEKRVRLYTTVPLRASEGGSLIKLTIRDVTEQKRNEEALRESEARYRQLFQNMLDGFAYCRMHFDEHGHPEDFVYLDVNAAFGRLTGLHDVVGKRVSEVIPGIWETETELLETYGRVAKTGQPERFEIDFKPLGVWFSISVYSPLPDHFVAVFDNITERKKAEEALRRSEERLRALADSMPQLAWTAQPDGYITWYNGRWYEYTGTTPQQMEGWGWQCVHDPATLPDVLLRWKASIGTGTAFDMEFPLRGADGKFRRFLTRVFPLKDQDGKVLQWFGTNTDVTELVEAQEALREASRLKDDFLSMASHELRTPLTVLRLQADSFARSLRTSDGADERVERRLSAMGSQFDRLEALVRTLLDVSRITAGRLDLDLAEFDLAELIKEVTEHLEPQAENARTELRLRTREVVGRWDRMRLDQVVTNLVSNAIKYGNGMPVEVTLDERDGTAVLMVRDHGIGIALDSQQRIFERFERAANTNAVSGLGLGLWIARRIVEAHGGEIAVESAPAAGATFTVTLPKSAA